MATIFDYNDRAFKEFSKFYNKAPSRARKASARMLSKFAFGTRNEAIIEINRTMSVRNKRFVARGMRFQNARPTNIDNQFSVAGSISGNRFSGWKENYEGSRDNRTRTHSLLSRSGSWKKKIKPSVRMKPARDFLSISDFSKETSRSSNPNAVFLALMKKKKKNKAFIMKKRYKGLKKGVYKYTGRKLKRLIDLEPKSRSVKRNRWLDTARNRFFAKNNLDELWKEAISDLFKSKRF